MESFLLTLSKLNASFSAHPQTESPLSYFGNDNKLGFISTVPFIQFGALHQLLNETYNKGGLLQSTVICNLLNLTEIELSDMAHDISLHHEYIEYIQTLPRRKKFLFVCGFYRWDKSMFSGNVEFGWIY